MDSNPSLRLSLLPVLFLAFAVCTVARAQPPAPAPEPFLFANLNRAFDEGGSEPHVVGRVAGVMLFTAEDDAYGRELWRTDGTARGTFLLVDFCPGRCSFSIGATARPPETDLLFLEVGRAGEGLELWRTDGTVEGTFVLHVAPTARFIEGAWSGDLERFVFRSHDDATGSEPWVSDGTVAGTRRLDDLLEGPVGSDPADFRPMGGWIFFTATEPLHGREVWRTDGAADGTRRVTDLAPGPEDGVSQVAGRVGEVLVVVRREANEVWAVADGLPPRKLMDLEDGAPRIVRFAGDGQRLLLQVDVDADTWQLWATDGTPGGTRLLRQAVRAPTGVDSFPNAAPVGSLTLFSLYTPETGREPWITDGTPGGTRLLADLCPGPCSSGSGVAWRVGDRGIVFADDGVRGLEPWGTDGTPAGTALLADVCPGPCSGGLWGVSRQGYLIGADGPGEAGEWVLWRTDGTPAGTAPVRGGFDLLRPVFDQPDGAFFSGDDGNGLEPWWTDGTAAGTRPLGDLLLGREAGSSPELLVRSATAGGERLFFVATGTDGFRGLWVGDGTVEGTGPVPGSPDLSAAPPHKMRLVAGAGGAFLLVEDDELGPDAAFTSTLWWSDGLVPTRQLARIGTDRGPLERVGIHGDGQRLFVLAEGLWVSDGSVAGTGPLLDVPFTTYPGRAVLVGGVLYFVAPEDPQEPSFALALWRSDGTPGGTTAWFRDPSWDFGGDVKELAAAGAGDGAGGFWFVADHGEDVGQLWRSDGTLAGTGVAVELDEGVQPSRLLPADGRLFFSGSSGSGAGWWVSDGTVAGTVDLQTAPPGPAAVIGGSAEVVHRGELVFFGFDRGLYRTDGTVVVPFLFSFLVPPDHLDAALFVALDRLFVVTRLPGRPWQLWMLDDLADPAVLLAEYPGESFGPDGLTGLGSRIFFSAPDREVGRELWAMDFAAPPPPRPEATCVPDAEHLCLLDGRFRVRVDWRDPRTGNTGTGGAAPLPDSRRTGTFWFFDPANIELIVKMLDGEPVNGFYWTFYGALSDVEYWIDVEDTVSRWTRTYHNPPREICGRADTGTFEIGAFSAASTGRPATAAERVRRITTEEIPDCAEKGVLCLRDGRFRLEVSWRDQRTGDTGTGTAIPGTDRSGYFWFFRDDNVELVAKVLDGTPVNGYHWVFYGALTDVEYDLRVVDADAGEERIYHNPPGNVCGGADTAAFGAGSP